MGNQSTVEPPPHPPPSQTAGAKRGLRIFRGQRYSREQVKYYLIQENKYFLVHWGILATLSGKLDPDR